MEDNFMADGNKEEFKMQFLVKAYDGSGMLEKRMEVRPSHLEVNHMWSRESGRRSRSK